MDHILERCTGIICIADGVAVFGKYEKEHDANSHNLMKMAQQEGLVFNPDKCDINKQKMRFFGLEFSCQGVNPDPEKIAATSQLQTPKYAVQLPKLFGIATCMAPFAPNLSQHTAILRELLSDAIPRHSFQEDQAIYMQGNHVELFRPKGRDTCASRRLKPWPRCRPDTERQTDCIEITKRL